MTLYTLSYRGYTIHGQADKFEVRYQSPWWPKDPRIVKVGSLKAAKRRIREEISRIERHGSENIVYLALATEETPQGWRKRWRIIDVEKQDLIQPYFQKLDEAQSFCENRGWALLEYFDY